MTITENEGMFLFNRPANMSGPPIHLFSKAIRRFQSRRIAQDPVQISNEDMVQTWDLLNKSADIYTHERQRRVEVEPLLGGLLKMPFYEAVSHDRCPNTGIAVFTSAVNQALLVLCEYKGALAADHSDPTIRAGFAYAKWWSGSRNVGHFM